MMSSKSMGKELELRGITKSDSKDGEKKPSQGRLPGFATRVEGNERVNPLHWDLLSNQLKQRLDLGNKNLSASLDQLPLGKLSSYSEPCSLDLESHTDSKKKNRRITQPPNTKEYVATSHDSLASIALQHDTLPSELKRLNKLTSQMLFPGQILFVPVRKDSTDEESNRHASESSEKSSRNLSNNESDKIVQEVIRSGRTSSLNDNEDTQPRSVTLSMSEEEDEVSDIFLKINVKRITEKLGTVKGVLLVTPQSIMFNPYVSDPLVMENGSNCYEVVAPLGRVTSAAMHHDLTIMKKFSGKKQRSSKSDPEAPIYRSKDTNPLFGNKSDPPLSNLDIRQKLAGHESHDSVSSEVSVSSESGSLFSVLINKDSAGFASVSYVPRHSTSSGQQYSTGTGTDKVRSATDPYRSNSETDSEVKRGLPSPGIAVSIPFNEPQQEKTTVDIDKVTKEVLEKEGSKLQDRTPDGKSTQASQHPEESEDKSVCNDEQVASAHSKYSQAGDTEKDDSVFDESGSKNDFKPLKQEQRQKPEMPFYLCVHVEHVPKAKAVKEPSDSSLASTALSTAADLAKSTINFARQSIPGHATASTNTNDNSEKVTLRNSFFVHEDNNDKLPYRKEFWFAVPSNRVDQLYSFFIHWSPNIYGHEEDFEVLDDGIAAAVRRRSVQMLSKSFDISQITTIDSIEEDFNIPLPEMIGGTTQLLSEDDMGFLSENMPSRCIGYNWYMIYSTFLHGISLKTLYRNMAEWDTPVLLIIRDYNEYVFGAVISSEIRMSDGYYGTGESFMFTIKPERKIYQWTGQNNYIIKGDTDGFAIGGGDGRYGLWIDEDLYNGSCSPCQTFDNSIMSKTEHFHCQVLEAWGFT